MYEKMVITRKYDDERGNIRSVTIGFFDRTGQLQTEIHQISGKLFPAGIQQGKEVIFNYPAQVFDIKK